jgi:hypothetical protein
MTNQQSVSSPAEIYENKKIAGKVVMFSIGLWLILTIGTLLVPPIVTSNFLGGPAISACKVFKDNGQLPNLTSQNSIVSYRDATPQQIDIFCESAIAEAKSTGGFVGWFFGVIASIMLGLFIYPRLTFLPALKASEKAQAQVVEMEQKLGLLTKTPEELVETELAEFDSRLAISDKKTAE